MVEEVRHDLRAEFVLITYFKFYIALNTCTTGGKIL